MTAHPLSGADRSTLRRVLREAGPNLDRRRVAAIRASVFGRTPLTQAERVLAPRLAAAPVEAPVFILGHWRSGTTHLYNVLARAGFGTLGPVAAGLPHEMLTLARYGRPLLDRLLPRSRYIDAVPVTPDSPQEDEPAIANMTAVSFYHALYFPGRFDALLDRGLFFDGVGEAGAAEWEAAFDLLLRKLQATTRTPLLVKNPVHTARAARILRLYPDARFVHITRDPYDVFVSMRNFYAKLLPVLALQPYGHVDVDAAILRTYRRMMEAFEADTEGWSAPRLHEVSYGALDRDPIGTLRGVYDALRLEGWSDAEPVFRAYLASVRGYRKNSFDRDPEASATVDAALAPWVERYREAV